MQIQSGLKLVSQWGRMSHIFTSQPTQNGNQINTSCLRQVFRFLQCILQKLF